MGITIQNLRNYKQNGEKFSCLTAYDASFAQAVSSAGIDVILVGDSLGMVLQGNDSTLPVTIEDMAYHTQCVSQGNQGALIMADMPFMSYSNTVDALANAAILMQAGAHMVKLEGGDWLCETTRCLAEQGIPSCLHLGLTPQSVNKFGGYKVQGKADEQAEKMLSDAIALDKSGADVILLECVPTPLAKRITESVSAPVIGIGAGNVTDGQVLVMHDMLAVTSGRKPKFVKNFMEQAGSIDGAFRLYDKSVKDGSFPAEEHSFSA